MFHSFISIYSNFTHSSKANPSPISFGRKYLELIFLFLLKYTTYFADEISPGAISCGYLAVAII
jgi:hypothetical protein